MSDVKFPQIKVQLTGRDGNAFAIMGAVASAMRMGGCTPEQIEAYHAEAMDGDYDHLLQVSMRTVRVR